LPSPLKEEEDQFEELGIRMKRNNVALDIINFAHPENVPKLQTLIRAADNNRNSHFLDVPLGVAQITDVLIASPIINQDEDGGAGAMGAGAAAGFGAGAGIGGAPSQFADFGGIDPNLDPELAQAIRISLEEQRARQNEPEQQPAAGQPAG
jgi:26S proteasome regulatory subunit N10